MATASETVCRGETEDVILVPAEDEYTPELFCSDSFSESLSGSFNSSFNWSHRSTIFTNDSITEHTARSTMKNLEDKDESISILFAGKQGVGKSSLINGLIGKEVATEGANPYSVTKCLGRKYEGEYVQSDGRRVQVTVWDTQGLDGSRNDRENIVHLQKILLRIDLLVYCISVVGGRLDERVLRKFAKIRPEIWQNSVVALTQANNITETATCETEEEKKEHFKETVQVWAQAIGICLQKCRIPLDVIDAIPVVPTGYHRKTGSILNPFSLPTCNDWLKIFWYQCLNKCHKKAQLLLVQQNKERFRSDVSANEDLPINERTISLTAEEEECCYNAVGRKMSVKETIISWIKKIKEYFKWEKK